MTETLWHVAVLVVLAIAVGSAMNLSVPANPTAGTQGLADAISGFGPAILGLILLGAGGVAYSLVPRSW